MPATARSALRLRAWDRRPIVAAVIVGAVTVAVAFVGPAAASAVAPGQEEPGQVAAATPEERQQAVDRAIEETRHALEGTSSALTEAFVALQQSQAQLAAAQDRLAEARRVLEEAQERDVELAAQLAVARAEEQKAAAQLVEGQAVTARAHQQLGRVARDAYRSGGVSTSFTELSIALDASSPQEFTDRVVAVDTALRTQNGAIATLAAQQAENRASGLRLQAVRAHVAELKAQAQEAVAAATRAEQAVAAAEADAARLVTEQAGLVAQVEARKADEANRLAALEAEAAQLRALIARLAEEARQRAAAEAAAREQARREAAARAQGGRAGGVPAPPPPAPPDDGTRDGALLRPTNTRITSEFGMRLHPIYGVLRLHSGMDFGGPCGTAIRAAESGTVVSTGYAGGAGNRTIIDHGIARGVPLVTVYMHLSSFAAGPGQRVERGQVIGYVGTTGASTGCHLHFETWEDGTPVNPRGWL